MGNLTAEAQPPAPEAEGPAEASNLNDAGAGHGAGHVLPLPPVPAGADLAQPQAKGRRLALSMAGCFCITFLAYVIFIPRFVLYSNPPTGDQPFYLMDDASLAQDWDLNVKNNYDNKDFDKFYKFKPKGFVGQSSPYPLGRQLAESPARPKTEQYSAHPPGLPILLLPGWIVGSWFGLWWPATLVVTCLLGALVCLNIFLLAHEITGRLWVAWLVWLPIAFSNPIMTHSYLVFTELPVGLLLVYAFRRLALGWQANGRWRLLLVGLCIAYIPWLSLRCLPIVAVLVLYAAVQWGRWNVRTLERWNVERLKRWKIGRFQVPNVSTFQRSNVLTLGWLAAPLIISAVIFESFNFYKTGSLLPSASSEQGRVEHFYWPWAGLEDLTRFITAAFGHLFDSRFGLLPYTPVYLLAVVGIVAMFRTGRGSDRRLLLWMALLFVPYMTLITAYEGWHGVWNPPARYPTTFLPLLAAPFAVSIYAFSRSWWRAIIYGIVYAALSLVGFIAMTAILFDPRLIWPEDLARIYAWLVIDDASFLRVDVIGLMPNFLDLDASQHPLLSGQMIGAALLIVVVLSLLLPLRRAMGGGRRWPVAAQGGAYLAAISLVGAGWYVMNYDFLKPITTLTQEQSWPIPIRLEEPYGITYMDGKLYVTDYARHAKGTVGALDLTSGNFETITPTLSGGHIEFAHPSDVKAGLDGMLYVLNNGADTGALYVMKPDGQIVRQIALDKKSLIATELYLGSDGSYYIADMQGGAILHYGKDGGTALGVWGGEKQGFNNPAGVAIGKDGEVYAAENGYGLIHELSPDGKFVRKYDLKCQPIHEVVNGDWVDITCDKGLRSINTKGRFIQLSAFKPRDSQPVAPRGLTYGPDNSLYILDMNSNSVIRYKVAH